MTKSKLKTRIKNFTKNDLSQHGFSLNTPTTIERKVPGFIQGISFQLGTSYLKGKYTLNIYHRFEYHKRDYIAFDGSIRIGQLMGEGDKWFTFEGEQLESELLLVKNEIYNVVLPYHDKFSSLEKLIHSYENNEISKRRAFGEDVGWQSFNAGFSYAALGRKKEAILELNDVIHNHSSKPVEFIQQRKIYAEKKLNDVLADNG